MVAKLQQEKLVTEKELEALEAAEMAWLVRSTRVPWKEGQSGVRGERVAGVVGRNRDQAVGQEREERERARERRSAKVLHQAKCLWVGRAVDAQVCVSAELRVLFFVNW